MSSSLSLCPFSIGGSSGSGNGGATGSAAGVVPSAGSTAVVVDAVAADYVDTDAYGDTPPIKGKIRPKTPSKEEIAIHNITHYPYRAWCRHCVAGQGRRDKHHSATEESTDPTVATIAMDYGFFCDDDKDSSAEAEFSPILVVKDKQMQAVFADVMPHKGASHYATKTVVEHIVWLGHPCVKLRTDGEPAVRALAASVAAALKGKNVRTVPDLTPKGDSQAGCIQESAVHQVKGKCRTICAHAAETHGVTIGPTHHLLPWAVQYAAQLIVRTVVAPDGTTGYRRITGRRAVPRPMLPWGDKVQYIPGGGKAKAGVKPKLEDGILLGVLDQSSEYIVGTPEGAVKSGTVKPVNEEDSCDPALFASVKGLPWKWDPTNTEPQRGDPAERPCRIVLQPVVPTDQLPDPLVHGSSDPRRVYIRKNVELRRYGMTDQCRGCLAAATGGKPAMHDETCRARIEKALEEDAEMGGAERMREAKKRKTEEEATSAVSPAVSPPAPGHADPIQQVPSAVSPAVVPTQPQGEKRAGENLSREVESDMQMDELSFDFDEDCEELMLFNEELEYRQAEKQVLREVCGPKTETEILDALQLESGTQREVLGMLEALGAGTVHVAEIFCPPRFTASAKRFGLLPGMAMDLKNGWNLDDPKQVEEAWTYLRTARPYLLVGSPECKAFSALQTLNKRDAKYYETLAKCTAHLELVCQMYKFQHSQGRLFMHEHPWGASSWHLKCVQEILKLPNVSVAYCDQCMLGQSVVDRSGHHGFAKKPTGFMTNSAEIKKSLSVMCDGGHDHIPLVGGLAKHCAAYPPRLVYAVLKALRKELQSVGHLNEFEVGATVEEPPPENEWLEEFYDEVTGVLLDPQLVEKARAEEIEYMHKLRVYVQSSWEAAAAKGCKPIPVRWLDLNKGDDTNVNIRSRCVAQETKGRSTLGKDDAFATFAATPPLEALRMMCSLMMSYLGQDGKPMTSRSDRKVMGFYDVSRAHFHSDARRDLFIIPPQEDTTITGVAQLMKGMYGTRDAGQCFDHKSETTMKDLGFTVGLCTPCIYHHPEKDAVCFRHGDDFVLLASRAVQDWFFEAVKEHLLMKRMGVLGPDASQGDVQEMRVLNRLIRYVQPLYKPDSCAYLEWEPDPRHAEILVSQAGLGDGRAKALTTPGIKMPKGTDETPLSAGEKQSYRSMTMRVGYLAQDRPDLQFCAKELARCMNEPSRWDKEQLKRTCRYLIGMGRVVQRFKAQQLPTRVVVRSDSDHAGCLKTRKSTSCTMVFLGDHMTRSTATTQAVISLSSGESEFYASVKAASVGLGTVALLRDMGHALTEPVSLQMDATAGIGIASRRGAGRIRHIATPTLWLQCAVQDGRIKLAKIPGKENPADLGTKHVEREVIDRTLKQCGFMRLEGQSAKALKAAV